MKVNRPDAVVYDDVITEVEFLALPGTGDVRRMLEKTDQLTDGRKAALTRSYHRKLQHIAHLQRKAAVEALAACRPNDWQESDRQYRHEVMVACHEHESRCLKVFTDKCTRGL